MKVIKVVVFLLQSGLVGIALAAIYLYATSDRSRDEILAFMESAEVSAWPEGNGAGIGSYAAAVERSAASVVTIYTSRTVEERGHPLLEDPVFSQYFGDQFERRQRNRGDTNLGSGVIIGSDGYILTNQHVIDGADKILISLADGRKGQAKLIGEDRDTDIAILQTQLGGLAGIEIADSGRLRVGDVVLAIGNPLNVGQTVTMGIVSATGRNRIGLNTFENFIQTDAAINPGNSGGALVNARGDLVGINTAYFSQAIGAQGIGFAIPISLVLEIMPQIIEFGKVSRGWLGVEGTEINEGAARATGNPGIQGALIVGIFVGSPADMAGIRAGDIVVAVDDNPVHGIRDLLDQITHHKPGDEVGVELYRGTQRLTLTMKVSQRPRQ